MADHDHAEIDDLLREDRTFPPPPEFRARADRARRRACTRKRSAIPKRSGNRLPRELEWSPPWDASSTGSRRTRSGSSAGRSTPASTASIATCDGPRRNKAALVWEGEPGDRRTLTYWDLYREVSTFANVLNSLGVGKGDRVAIYMPMIPELAIAMLACARIGAVHSVVFGGFSAESLRDRINDSARRCWSPPTAAIVADRSCRSSRWPTRRSRTRRPSSTSSSSAQARAVAPVTHEARATTGITS